MQNTHPLTVNPTRTRVTWGRRTPATWTRILVLGLLTLFLPSCVLIVDGDALSDALFQEITLGESRTDQSLSGNDRRLYRFTASNRGDHTVSITALTTNGDLYLYSTSSDALNDTNRVDQSENTGTNNDALIAGLTSGQEYFVVVREKSGSSGTLIPCGPR
jgi:hypothetical protein